MTDDIPTTSKPIRDNYGIRGRHAHGRFGCRDCGEIFQTSLKLYRHRVSHLPVVRIKFLGKVVIEFQKHADNRVECLCGKDITIVNMISVHKYHCQACMEEARRRLDQKPESTIPSNEHGQQPQTHVAKSTEKPAPSSNEAVASTGVEEDSQELDASTPLGKLGLYLHAPTRLLICSMCRYAVIMPEIRKHLVWCVSHPHSPRRFMPSNRAITATKRFLEKSPVTPHDAASYKVWMESCRGTRIQKIPGLPIVKAKKCTTCGHLCDKRSAHIYHMHKVHNTAPSSISAAVAVAQRPLFTNSSSGIIEIINEQGNTGSADAMSKQDMEALVELRVLLGYT